MDAKHTPGPWQIARYNDDTSMCEIETVARGVDVPDQGYTIASVYAGAYDAGPDARLIAAAPDLLASLRGMVFHSPSKDKMTAGQSEWFDRARAAIAKAEGEEEDRPAMRPASSITGNLSLEELKKAEGRND